MLLLCFFPRFIYGQYFRGRRSRIKGMTHVYRDSRFFPSIMPGYYAGMKLRNMGAISRCERESGKKIFSAT